MRVHKRRLGVLVVAQQGGHVYRRLKIDDPLRYAHRPTLLVDVGHLHQLLGQVERRTLPIQEAGDAATAQEAHGLELLDRGIHRVKAVGVKLEGAD